MMAWRKSRTGAAAPVAVHHCNAHARASMSSAGGPAVAVQARACKRTAASTISGSCSPRNGYMRCATDLRECPMQVRLAGIGAGCGHRAWGPLDAGPQVPAVLEIASARPLLYAWNKLK